MLQELQVYVLMTCELNTSAGLVMESVLTGNGAMAGCKLCSNDGICGVNSLAYICCRKSWQVVDANPTVYDCLSSTLQTTHRVK